MVGPPRPPARAASMPVHDCEVVRVAGGASTACADRVAREAPLEVRLHGEPFSVIMRTPGADRDLAAGFLFSENVIAGAADLAGVEEIDDGAIDVTLAGPCAAALPEILGTRRHVAMNASCGMCGRRTLESLEVSGAPLAASWRVPAPVVAALPASLAAAQPVFAETGGLHAAALFDRQGRIEASAEDVGRHNAVDKLVGRMLLAGRLPLDGMLLFVSGRSSFEIVQKAYLASIPVVAAVSAPSSLAVDLARETGITLAGFVRDGRFNLYTHPHRVEV